MDGFVDFEPLGLDDDVVAIEIFTELVEFIDVVPDGEQLNIQLIELQRDVRLQVSIEVQQGEDLGVGIMNHTSLLKKL